MERLSDTDALVALERRLLIRPEHNGRRIDISVRHPVYGEHIRATTSQLLARGIRGQLIDIVVELGARRADDLTRLADWSLKIGRTLPAEIAIRTARQRARVRRPGHRRAHRPLGVGRLGFGRRRLRRGRGALRARRRTRRWSTSSPPRYRPRTRRPPIGSSTSACGRRCSSAAIRAWRGRCSPEPAATPITSGTNASRSTRSSRSTGRCELVGDGRLLDAEAELRSAFDTHRSGTAAAAPSRRHARLGAPVARPSGRGDRARTASRARDLTAQRAPDAGQVGVAGDRTRRRHGAVAEHRRRGAHRARRSRCRRPSTLPPARRRRPPAARPRPRRGPPDTHRRRGGGGRGRTMVRGGVAPPRAGPTSATADPPVSPSSPREHGGLVTLFADHAARWTDDDEALADVAERFAAGRGARHRQPGDGASRRGRRGDGRTAAAPGDGALDGTSSPPRCDAPVALAPNTAVEPLTPREHEVAPDGRRRAHQPRGRRPVRAIGAHRRQPPRPRVHQARHRLTRRATRRARRRRSLGTQRSETVSHAHRFE